MLELNRPPEAQANKAAFVIGGSFAPKSLLTPLAPDRGCEQAGIANDHCSVGAPPDWLFDCKPSRPSIRYQLRRLARIFSLADADKSGSLDHGEVSAMLKM